ncbi:MAG TPA: phage holin family protein [Candidatus Sulfotelmatobacter sp.]|nr:phage holin family protein [Candidatus Sulfotelmatobacter sp.]
MNSDIHNGRSLAAILGDMKDELQEFAHTRIELFRREVQEKISAVKAAIPGVLIGAAFLGTAFLLFSLALVSLIAVAFGDNSYKWFFALLIVGIFWSMIGALALFLAKQRVTREPMVPQKTITVLKDDKVWLQRETRNAL